MNPWLIYLDFLKISLFQVSNVHVHTQNYSKFSWNYFSFHHIQHNSHEQSYRQCRCPNLPPVVANLQSGIQGLSMPTRSPMLQWYGYKLWYDTTQHWQTESIDTADLKNSRYGHLITAKTELLVFLGHVIQPNSHKQSCIQLRWCTNVQLLIANYEVDSKDP